MSALGDPRPKFVKRRHFHFFRMLDQRFPDNDERYISENLTRLDLYFFWILDLAILGDEMAKPSMNTLDPSQILLRAIIITMKKYHHHDEKIIS